MKMIVRLWDNLVVTHWIFQHMPKGRRKHLYVNAVLFLLFVAACIITVPDFPFTLILWAVAFTMNGATLATHWIHGKAALGVVVMVMTCPKCNEIVGHPNPQKNEALMAHHNEIHHTEAEI